MLQSQLDGLAAAFELASRLNQEEMVMFVLAFFSLGQGLYAFVEGILMTCLYATPPHKISVPNLAPKRAEDRLGSAGVLTPTSTTRGHIESSPTSRSRSPKRSLSSAKKQQREAEEAHLKRLMSEAKQRYNELTSALGTLQRFIRRRT